jgi:NADH-quinone oxidoreductase subunit C
MTTPSTSGPIPPVNSTVDLPAAANTQHLEAEPAAELVPAGAVRGPGETIEVRRGMFGNAGTPDTSGYGGLVRHISMPGPTARPYGGWYDEVADALEEHLPDYGGAVEAVVIARDEMTFMVRRERLPEVMRTLRDQQSLRFEMCLGVSGVHFPGEQGRELHAVYPLLSITYNRRIRVETTCPDGDPRVPSVVSIYPTNDWHERETFDMFGIVFDGHPALTRILMPDDWPGHPQRKDYPLGGIPVEYKGATVPPPDVRRGYA